MTIQKYKVGPGVLKLGPVDGSSVIPDLSAQVTSGVVKWDNDTDDPISVLDGEEEAGDTTWSATLSGTMYQDNADIQQWTWDNKGKTVPAVFIPLAQSGKKKVTGNVTVLPLDFGGDVKTSPTSDFEWSYVGEPVLSDVTSDDIPPVDTSTGSAGTPADEV